MDDRLRELERKARESGLPDDLHAWERALVRGGMDPQDAEVEAFGMGADWVLAAPIGGETWHIFGDAAGRSGGGYVGTVCDGEGTVFKREDAARAEWVRRNQSNRLCALCVVNVGARRAPFAGALGECMTQYESAFYVKFAFKIVKKTIACLRGHPWTTVPCSVCGWRPSTGEFGRSGGSGIASGEEFGRPEFKSG